jgi:hypothetical protein
MPAVDPEACKEITQLSTEIHALRRRVEKFNRDFDKHMIETERDKHILEELMTAFPDGVHNHREAHESMIRASQAKTDFYTDLQNTVIKRGILGAIIIILGLIWLGAQQYLIEHITHGGSS